MGITLLLVGVAVSIAAVYVTTTRPDAEIALAGETTVVGLAEAGSETLVGGHYQGKARTDWQLTPVDDLSDAEDLLDSLENQGVQERELIVMGNSSFAVRWR